MRWRVKKGGKLYSRGKRKVVGSGLEGADFEVTLADGAMEGVRAVPEGVIEGV